MNRMGVIGGTFDPIHFGHLFVAEEARTHFRLDRVLFVPNSVPPHKTGREITEFRHRFAMTEMATATNPTFECSTIERDRAGASYTVDTLQALRDERPETELFYITGVDAIADILTWKRHEEVILLAQFIAAARPGYDSAILSVRLPEAYLHQIHVLNSTALDISSTDLRQRVREGRSIRYLTPDDVVEYITRNRLYRGNREQETGQFHRNTCALAFECEARHGRTPQAEEFIPLTLSNISLRKGTDFYA